MMIPYAKHSITEEDIQAVVEVLRSDTIARGYKIAEFEDELAEFCGTKYAVACSSGSTGLLMAMQAAREVAGLRFIALPYTEFRAAKNAHEYVFGPDSLYYYDNMDGPELNVPYMDVCLGGYPLSMCSSVTNPAEGPRPIILDACQALGAEYNNGMRLGDGLYSGMIVFSFHPAKQITTGEGGAVLTDDQEIYETLKYIRNNGLFSGQCGMNFWMTDFQAALGISQLKRLPGKIERMRSMVKLYLSHLPKEVIPGFIKDIERASPSLMIILVKSLETKGRIITALDSRGYKTAVHFPAQIYTSSVYERLFKRPVAAERWENTALSIPLWDGLPDAHIRMIISIIKENL